MRRPRKAGPASLKINADTNLLLRICLNDDPVQHKVAVDLVTNAEAILIPIPALCEFAWVLSRSFKRTAQELIGLIELLLRIPGVVTNERSVQLGIEMLKAGGDFADGAIAEIGYQKGATFVSFDRQAVNRLRSMKLPAMLAE